MIIADNVTMSYGREPVVKDVCLRLPAAGLTALIGPNGAGKSTFLAGVGRLHPLLEGSIKIDDCEVKEWDSRALARTLAVLRQDNHLSVRLTVAQLALLGRFPHSRGNPAEEDFSIVSKALEQVDMKSLENRFLDELSGGQRQRAFVAMALAQQTKHLLLDEPLSALDMRYSRQLMRYLVRASQERQMGVVIVIHDINMAAAYATRMIAMKQGQIIADGTPEEVMTQDCLSYVFDVDVEVTTVSGRPRAFPVL